MPQDRTCLNCGTPLPPNAPPGQCPACLLRIGMALADGGLGLGNQPASDSVLAAEAPAARPTMQVKPAGSSDEAVGQTIGRYKLLERIGEGGCGVVYVAEQTEPVRRRVALKVIKLGMDTKQVVARFEAERQALAMMDHPNIAKVFDAGTIGAPDSQLSTPNSQLLQGRPYFVMELVRGIRITDYCDQAQLSTKDRLDLFIKVCQAIQHAHQKGIIHRDIKPSNILVTLHDGVPVPKVIDFGIAKATEGRLTDATVYTQLHQFIGTPAYMSPEQAEMSGLDIDTRSDIYSLGVLLYELLAGSTPFDAKDLMVSGIDAMRKIIREKEPVRPSTRLTKELVAADVSPRKSSSGLAIPTQEEASADSRRRLRLKEQIARVRGDLDWIVMKCLEKDRARRYETANGLAADLKRHLDNEPVVARPPTAAYRFQKAFRRNKLAFTAATAVAAALVIGIGVSIWQMVRATRAEREQSQLREIAVKALAGEKTQRAKAETEQEHAQVEADHARVNAYEADMNLVQQAMNESNLGRAVELLERHRPARGQKDLRGWEWRYLWWRSRSDERATIANLPGGVMALAFTPGYEVLAGADRSGSVRFWNASSWHEIDLLEVGTALRSMALSPDGQLVALGTLDNQVTVWDWRQKKQTGRFGMAHGDYHGNKLVFSPDGSALVAADEHGFIELRSTKDFHQTRRWSAHGDRIRGLAFSRDGRLLASGGDDNTVRIWDTVTWELRTTIPAPVHEFSVNNLQFSADGKRLLTCGVDPVIKLWDLSAAQQIATFKGHTAHIFTAIFSPDGSLVASAGGDQTIRIWETATQRQIARLQGHGDEVGPLAFSQDGKTLVSGAKDGVIKLWNVPQRRDDPAFQPGPVGVFAGDLSEDGRFSVAYSPAGIEAWSTLERKQLCLIPFAADRELLVGPFAINGGVVAFRWLEGAVRIFSLSPFQEVASLPNPTAGSNRTNSELALLALSDDGKFLAAVGVAGEVEVLDWSARRSLARMTIRAYPSSLKFAPDGRFLASGHADGTVQLWQVDGGSRPATLKAHQSRVEALAFSPDGRLLATGGADSVTKVWERSSQRLLATLHLYRFSVSGLAFTPDVTRLATATEDGSIKFWNLNTYQEVLTLKAHPTKSRLAFTPGSETMVSGSIDGVRYWSAPSLTEIEATEADAKKKEAR